ncbi:MAG TPA: methylmalonyl Co-A mutase-associated GTPase MeaB [candidate division Zixibacteria bacterium]|nr:methylmalonyl Co-A mutase-associated GTPase MeaB [candidate division Zixibacteria bacterium]
MDSTTTSLEQFDCGSARALARVISAIEDGEPGHEGLLGELYRRRSGSAYRVGVTGPPGAGKSSLVDKIALERRWRDARIGIIAVDPSSPFTGGALLGDRVRMRDLAVLENVFIRSMASRGSMGGLARATKDVLVALEAFGEELILLETVGVGQVELDVVDACDTVVVVLTPESGDSIQAMKSGIIEIADIFAINKSDREGAEFFAVELSSILELKGGGDDRWMPPIIPTVATSGEGIEELVSAIDSHRKFAFESGLFKERRIRQIERKIRDTIAERIERIIEGRILSSEDLRDVAEDIMAGKSDPYSFVDEKFPPEKFCNT